MRKPRISLTASSSEHDTHHKRYTVLKAFIVAGPNVNIMDEHKLITVTLRTMCLQTTSAQLSPDLDRSWRYKCESDRGAGWSCAFSIKEN